MKTIPVIYFDSMDSPHELKSKEIRITEKGTPTLSAFMIQIAEDNEVHVELLINRTDLEKIAHELSSFLELERF